MLDTLAQALQAAPWARELAGSIWVYPLVNTAHIVGIALLFGAIVPLDLRLLGCWRSVALQPLRRVLLPMAMGGFALAASSGALLFATRATEYLAQPLFVAKLGLILAALMNAAWLRATPGRRDDNGARANVGTPIRWKAAGLLSMTLWLAVITAGRLIGYR
jgi:hypothetical protein